MFFLNSSDSLSSSASDGEATGHSNTKTKSKKDKKEKKRHKHKHKHKHKHSNGEKHHKHKHKHKKHRKNRHETDQEKPPVEEKNSNGRHTLEDNNLEALEQCRALLEAQLEEAGTAAEFGEDGTVNAMSLIAQRYGSDSEEEGEIDHTDPVAAPLGEDTENAIEIEDRDSDVEFVKVENIPKKIKKRSRSRSRERGSKKKRAKESPPLAPSRHERMTRSPERERWRERDNRPSLRMDRMDEVHWESREHPRQRRRSLSPR